MRGNNLKGVARMNVIDGLSDHLFESILAGVRDWFRQRIDGGTTFTAVGERAREVSHHIGQAGCRLLIGGIGGHTVLSPHRSDDLDQVFYGIEDANHSRAQEKTVPDAERIRISVRDILEQPNGVITEISEKPGCRRWKIVRQIDLDSAISARRLSSGGTSTGSSSRHPRVHSG